MFRSTSVPATGERKVYISFVSLSVPP